jgi:hypothetical protein
MNKIQKEHERAVQLMKDIETGIQTRKNIWKDFTTPVEKPIQEK